MIRSKDTYQTWNQQPLKPLGHTFELNEKNTWVKKCSKVCPKRLQWLGQMTLLDVSSQFNGSGNCHQDDMPLCLSDFDSFGVSQPGASFLQNKYFYQHKSLHKH